MLSMKQSVELADSEAQELIKKVVFLSKARYISMTQSKVLVTSLIALVAIGEFTFFHNSTSEKEIPLEQQPIVNKEAVDDYKKGRISRESATAIIEKQLDELVDAGNLKDWTYLDMGKRYDITLSNGTMFAYYLK